MAVRVGINGFGRIGRNVFRAALHDSAIDIVAANDITDAATLAHLLKYDSVLGNLPEEVRADGDTIVAGGKSFKVLKERDPANLPWKALDVDIVIESTGLFTKRDDAAKHMDAGAKKVIISAPAKGEDITIVMGVNHEDYDASKHHVLSNASCTTNCLAPVAKVLHDEFGLRKGLMTTVHSYTNDQRLLDLPHSDLRRARAAALSMIPTTTGAAIAVTKVLPELVGRLDGIAVRVPTPNVSLTDLTAVLDERVSAEDVNNALEKAAKGKLEGILAFSNAPLVSSDFRGNSNSSIVDGPFTKVIADDTAKVLSWYDNEWGFSCRVVDLIHHLVARGL
ncbi:MAG TPA: type I glyceraldehyde-3-phosphate dehydrogenase [Vicinamibacteria bacterium]|nr:type I glyceraldehyde-3-phosphate dehydrogenase [Vicinamibacteria bacterium]